MQRVKFGVIGLGWFGQKHCEALAALPHVQLHAVCTRTQSKLDDVAERHQVPRKYTDYRRLLEDPEIDAVSIVTMWDEHVAPALAALEAGKHVFLEKPMASTLQDCQAIVAAAKRARGSFMVGHICRFNPRYAAAKREIESGKLGRIVSLYSRRNIPAWVTYEILNKIGPIMGDGVHDTDLMLWFTGDRIKTAYAQTLNLRGRKYPDLGWTMYRFAGGAIATLETVWCLPKGTPFAIDERMEIIGTEGAIHIQDAFPNFWVYSGEGSESPDITYWPELHRQRAGALRDELSYFAACIAAGRPVEIITPEESMAAVAACLAAERSADTGEVVAVED